jgi:hypothetical protein
MPSVAACVDTKTDAAHAVRAREHRAASASTTTV